MEAVATNVFSFVLDPADEGLRLGNVLDRGQGQRILKFLQGTFATDFSVLGKSATEGPKKVQTLILESKDSSILATMRIYQDVQLKNLKKQGPLLTLTLEHPSNEELFDQISTAVEEFVEAERLQGAGSDGAPLTVPDQDRVVHMSISNLASRPWPYSLTSDGRYLEYNFKEVLCNLRTQYQHILIVDTIDFGRMLFLDGMANLAESDVVPYTHSLMNLPHVKYDGARVLILGGGDGNLLKELLELEAGVPEHVLMLDIDDGVMTACSQHMRSVCGGYLDKGNRKGQNYEVVVTDAIKYMEEAKARGDRFDFVFGDLTDTPVDKDKSKVAAKTFEFMEKVMELAVSLLKPDTGKYLTHYNGKNSISSMSTYESMIQNISLDSHPGAKCVFTSTERFVPSFMETWIFYQISVKGTSPQL